MAFAVRRVVSGSLVRMWAWPRETAAPRPVRAATPWALACLSLGCGVIHAVVVAPHLREFPLYGWFFLAVALFQGAWAALVLMRPTRSLLLFGAVANLGIAVTWAWSRTIGLPIGPEPGVAEAIGVKDVISTTYEIVLAGVAAYAIVARRALERRAGQGVVAFALIIAVVTAIAVAVPEPAEHAEPMAAAALQDTAVVSNGAS